MIKNVTLLEGRDSSWGDGNAVVRLKQDELFHGRVKRDGESAEVQIPTGIPANDYNVTITLSDDGTVILGRLVHNKFEMS
jgi:hypothetical protein